MDKLALLALMIPALLLGFSSNAQLPDGSIAPDFTADDINGNTWNLYSLLAEGKTVILDFSATWCNPCWSYHNSGILSSLYDSHGPNGTDELQILFIESDPDTDLNDLLGEGENTLGDWTEGTDYPIIDNGQSIFWDYENSFYPTILMVCPSGTTKFFYWACEDEYLYFMQNHCGECSDPQACNFGLDNAVNEPCVYPGDACSDSAQNLIDGEINSSCECVTDGCSIPFACNFNADEGLNCDFYSCAEWTELSLEDFSSFGSGQIAIQSDEWQHWPEGASYTSAAIYTSIGTNGYAWCRDNSPNGSWGSPTNIFYNVDYDLEDGDALRVELELYWGSCDLWTYRLWGEDWGSPWGTGADLLEVNYLGNGRVDISSSGVIVSSLEVSPSSVFSHIFDPVLNQVETWLDDVLLCRTPLFSDFSGIQFNPQKVVDSDEAEVLINWIAVSSTENVIQLGCLDDAACNYDASANLDSGACLYEGTTCDDGDPSTLNDQLGNDCSCIGIPTVLGCTNSQACNYNVAANLDDGSCTFQGDSCDDGLAETIADVFNGECQCIGVPVVEGCMDNLACNFNTEANVSTNTCLYLGEPCNDGLDDTFNDSIDESCTCGGTPIVLGCMNESACNFNPSANTSDDNCLIVNAPCDDGDSNTDWDTVNSQCECEGIAVIWGCIDHAACNFNPNSNSDDGSCQYEGATCNDGNEFTINDTIDAYCECIGIPAIAGCMDDEACNFNINANTEDQSCLFVGQSCDDMDITTVDDIVDENCNCNGFSQEGCTDPTACNYDDNATYLGAAICLFAGQSCSDNSDLTINDVIQNDCSCMGYGCHDPEACNYSMGAGISDESLCNYLMPISISGNDATSLNSIETYGISGNSGSVYDWSADGAIFIDETNTLVALEWVSIGIHEVCVSETTVEGCVGEPNCLQVTVGADNVAETIHSDSPIEGVSMTSVGVRISLSQGSLPCDVRVSTLLGQIVYEGVATANILDIPVKTSSSTLTISTKPAHSSSWNHIKTNVIR